MTNNTTWHGLWKMTEYRMLFYVDDTYMDMTVNTTWHGETLLSEITGSKEGRIVRRETI